MLEWGECSHSLLLSSLKAFHFCFGFRECPAAWERWLFIEGAGDGGADREVLGHPQRVTSSSDQVLNPRDSSLFVCTFPSGGANRGSSS